MTLKTKFRTNIVLVILFTAIFGAIIALGLHNSTSRHDTNIHIRWDARTWLSRFIAQV